ncbi:hypothetical protein [Priestia megaterium]|uniref:hypothetical protein n=1 Tax=Priestia megaterium TaxID=1404 RepID=UPI000BF31AF6|nr:hypothetical protein [Priestia megaterium]MBD8848034.1 hypothetical protein [Priestia megaterium]MDN4865329.1 hypothetical protein [Priestia megaterium]MED4184342.1 hypothetical protein [Priestia megaterium]PFV93995.1 hypothetical protein COL08_22200 [Priestia megaterium]
MRNFTNTNKVRRYRADVNSFGTVVIHRRNPYIIACWSMAFPGFGHLLLEKYARGLILVTWEVFINQQTHLNRAMVYSFIGDIESTKAVLDVRLLFLYIPVYLFSIWDSYRTTVELNKIAVLVEREDGPFNTFSINAIGINYLEKRNPLMTFLWSLTVPSMGEFYLHRIIVAFFTLTWTVVFIYYSHLLEGIHYLILGNVEKSTSVLVTQWLLYIPSYYFFTIYEAYTSTVESNKLFEKEQKNYLKSHYQSPNFKINKGRKVT